MGLGSRTIGLLVGLMGLAATVAPVSRVIAQGPFGPRLDLSDAIQVDEADSATRNHLERVKAFIANQQWDEVVEVLRQVTEGHGGRVMAVSPWQFVNLRDYCHMQLASLPPEALTLYRGRVDTQARRWYEEGARLRDAGRLREVVDQLFCSSWGDDALLALGDLALEAGHPGEARGYWEKILPPDYWARLAPAVVQTNGSPVWLLYPDTDLDPAAIRARLLLAAILDGDRDGAGQALDQFCRECAAAEGTMGGRQVNYADFLRELLSQSAQWPGVKVDRQWATFAGSCERTKVFPHAVEVGPVAWEAALPGVAVSESGGTAAASLRVAEKRDHLLSYHPLVVDEMVLVNTLDQIRAYRLATGEAMWGENAAVYTLPAERSGLNDGRRGAAAALGAARFTMTVRDRRVYARLGSPVTTRVNEPQFVGKQSYVVCLDLDAEGKLIWKTSEAFDQDDDKSWAFEGSPVVDGAGVYITMRRSGVRPQQHVACLDPENGRLRWRRLVCGAETPAQGQEEITHNLLSLHASTLYSNTNLGAVAALSKHDGQVQWITRYPRAREMQLNKRAKHFYRDLTPCVYHQGLVYVAPADSELLMALDAPTGLLVWQTPFPDDVVHLLGVMDGKLVASGEKLWWIDAVRGKIVSPPGCPGAESFPEGGSPKGLGRGLLAGDRVYWPTWDKIYVFDQKANRQLEPIHLALRNATGGNLLPAGDSLLIAAHDRITVFRPEASGPSIKPADGAKISKAELGSNIK